MLMAVDRQELATRTPCDLCGANCGCCSCRVNGVRGNGEVNTELLRDRHRASQHAYRHEELTHVPHRVLGGVHQQAEDIGWQRRTAHATKIEQ